MIGYHNFSDMFSKRDMRSIKVMLEHESHFLQERNLIEWSN